MEKMIAVVPPAGIKAIMKASAQKPGAYKTLYLVLANLAGMGFGALLSYSVVLWILDGSPNTAIQVGAGTAFGVSALIIIHEWIHGVAYKALGAKNVYYGGNIKQFVFYAASDGDVLDGRQFRLVALAPFVVVTAACLCLMLLMPQYLVALLTVLCLHTLFCGGDFLFVHFLSQHDLNRLRTYDDRAKAESYFYYVD